MPKQSAKQRTVTRKQRIAAEESKFQVSSSTLGPGLGVEYLDTPVKSECDNNDYKAIKLSNGLRVLLVTDPTIAAQNRSRLTTPITNHDPACELNLTNVTCLKPGMVYCAIAINSGYLNNPPKFPCVAEILCATLCKASQKYPQPNRLSKLVERNGDCLSARVFGEITDFTLTVSEVHFPEASDRFVECFVGPLLTLKDVAEERDQIENHKRDALATKAECEWYERKDIFESIASTVAGQPGNYFGPQYMEYLHKQTDEDYFEEVKTFMKRHYTAQRMTVVIRGRLPLKTLEYYARTYFSKIPNNGLSPSDCTPLAVFTQFFDNPEFRMIHWTRPTNANPEERFDLELNWRMPSILSTYRSKPHAYLRWMLGNRSGGSLSSYLVKKLWCTHVVCKLANFYLYNNSAYSLVNVSLRLTDEGRENKKRILDIIFSYINFLRREGPKKQLHDEISKTKECLFRFDAGKINRAPCVEVHHSMLFFSPADYLAWSFRVFEYDEAVINDFIGLISPERANIIVHDYALGMRDDESCDDFGEEFDDHVVHRRHAIPKAWIDRWKTIEPLPDFSLPKCNEYFSEDDLVAAPVDPPDCPSMIYSDDFAKIWYKLDTKFRKRQCSLTFYFSNPIAGESEKNNFLVSMMSRLLAAKDKLESAVDAGFNFYFNPVSNGLVFAITGYSNKILLLAKEIVCFASNIATITTEYIFEACRDELYKSYIHNMTQPRKFATEIIDSIIQSRHWTSAEMALAAMTVDYNMFQTFAKRFMGQMRIDCLAYGNLMEPDVIQTVRECVAILRYKALSPKTLSPVLIREIPRGTRFCTFTTKTVISKASVVINCYQCIDQSLKQSVLVKLLAEFVVNVSLEHLRGNRNSISPVKLTANCLDDYSYCMSMENSEESVSLLDRKIEEYRKDLNQLFQFIGMKHWKDIKDETMRVLEAPDHCLNDEWNRHAREVWSQHLMFDRRERQLKILKSMTVKDLRRSMLDLTSIGPEMRKISVQVIGDAEKIEQLYMSCPMTIRALIADLLKPQSSTDLTNDQTAILDLDAYKRTLTTLPFLDVTTVDDLAEAIRKDCKVH